MPRSYGVLYAHIVFSTRHRTPFLLPPIWDALARYIVGAARASQNHVLQVGGTCDHVHVLIRMRRDARPSDVVRDIKANSSRWLRETRRVPETFAWQEGYGIFSVDPRRVGALRAYIVNQEEHHRNASFLHEIDLLFRLMGEEMDPHTVFE